MKKLLSIFLAFCMVIGSLTTFVACGGDDDDGDGGHTHSFNQGVCSCGATDPNYNPGQNPGESANNQVTDAEWLAAFNFGTNYVCTIINPDDENGEKLVLSRNGDLVAFEEIEYEGTEVLWSELWYYDLSANKLEYEPEYDSNDRLVYFTVRNFNATVADMEEYFFGDALIPYLNLKSSFVYDSASDKYVATTFTLTDGDDSLTLSNVKIAFANKKIASISYDVDGYDAYTTNIAFTYGNANVVMPTNVYNSQDVIGGSFTVEDFENALNKGTNYSILFTENDLTDGDEIFNEYSRNGDVLYHKYTKYNASDVLVGSHDEYKQIVGEFVYGYHYDESSDTYSKAYSPESAEKIDVDLYTDCSFIEDLQNPYLYTFVTENGVNYLTLDRYESSDRQYMGQYIAEINYVYTNVKIELDANNNIVKITFNLVGHIVVKNEQGATMNEINGNSNMTLELSFGDSELELPTNIFDPSTQGGK